jgi:hypothetical protein
MPDKPKPRKTRIDAIPDELIGKALMACGGRIFHSADKVGLSGGSVAERIKKSPYLQQIREECLQKRLDGFEKALDELAEEHNLGAICFGLKTLGRSRGYVEHHQQSFGSEIAQGLESVLKQIEEYQSARKIANTSDIQQ